jgi:hypothetical protein
LGAPSFAVLDPLVARHKSGDTLADLDPVQVQRLARFGLATAWLLANR